MKPRDAVGGLRAALGFLTVLPGGGVAADRSQRAWAVTLFPLVGLVLGVILYGGMLLPLPPLLRAAVVLAAWVALTGGLHEDGWADTMDAAFAHVDREARIRILDDPRAGAHAVSGTVVILLVRFAALASVLPIAVLVAPVVGRGVMALTLALAPPLKETGLGARWAESARPWPAFFLTLLLVFAVAAAVAGSLPDPGAFSGWREALMGDPLYRGGIAVGAGGLAAWLFQAFLVRRMGGLSGDGHGAVGLLAETVALCAFVPVAPGALLPSMGLPG